MIIQTHFPWHTPVQRDRARATKKKQKLTTITDCSLVAAIYLVRLTNKALKRGGNLQEDTPVCQDLEIARHWHVIIPELSEFAHQKAFIHLCRLLEHNFLHRLFTLAAKN